jgi:hypothetical protein
VTAVADFLPVILAFLLGLTWGFMGAKDGKRLVFTVKTVVNPPTVEIKIDNMSGDPPTVVSPDAPGSVDSPDGPPGGRDPTSIGSGGGDGVT